MVLKISKRDIRSGNTFRAFKSRFQRQYLRQSCLIRRFEKKSKVNETVLDNFNIQHDIRYSLNKKARWEVPDILKDAILDGKYDDLKTNVQLIVYHNIDKRSHTVGYYSSKGNTRKIESTKKSYFNRKSVISDWDLFDQSTGCVEVVYPCPAASSIAYNAKKIGTYIEKKENIERKKPRMPKQKQKLTTTKYCEELDDLNTIDESEREEDIDGEFYEFLKRSACITESLENIISHAPRSRKHNLQENRNYKPKFFLQQKPETKGRTYYMPPTSLAIRETTTYKQVENSTIVPEKLVEFVHVVIPKTEFEECNLKEKYGTKYAKCPCFPRKFIIDISDRVEKQFKSSEHWIEDKICNLDPTSCVVFSHDASDALNTSTHHVFKVDFNMAANVGDFRISTIPDYFDGCIKDILHRTDLFVHTFPKDGFIEKEKEPLKVSTRRFGDLAQHRTSENEIIYLTRNSIYRNIFNECKLENTIDSLDYESVHVISSPCGICFDEVGDDVNPGTSLASCGHLFCDACWVSYCRSRVKTDSRPIACPEYGCSEIVDETVLLAFVNVLDVVDFKRRTREMSLQTSGCAKWCPNPGCGRVIKVKSPERTYDITCQCGMQICFHCLLHRHWPASCQSSSIYLQQLKHRGDDNLHFDLSVMQQKRGKPCPKCRRFIEKDGGCFIMACSCGANFCWGCLQLYDDHTYTDMCDGSNGDMKGTKSLAEAEAEGYANASAGSHYKMAVNHRKARHPVNFQMFKAGARDIKLKCKYIMRRKGPPYFSMFSETGETASVLSEQEVKRKIEDLLCNVMSVYHDLHHIAEYSHVLLAELDRKYDRSSKFCRNLYSLGICAREMSELISNSKDITDIRTILTSLIAIQETADRCIKETVKIARQIRK